MGQSVLDSMEVRFNRETGCLADKLMAALQGANVVGADTRCTSEGTSSLSAFLRVARPNDHPDTLTLDIVVPATGNGVEPLFVIQSLYDQFKMNSDYQCFPTSVKGNIDLHDLISVYPNPIKGGELSVKADLSCDFEVELIDLMGKTCFQSSFTAHNFHIKIPSDLLASGVYNLLIRTENGEVYSDKLVKIN